MLIQTWGVAPFRWHLVTLPHPHRWKNHLCIQVSLLSRPTRCRSSRCTTAACGVDVLPAGWTRIKPTTWWPRCCNTPRRLKPTFYFCLYYLKEWPQLCLGLNKSPIPQGWTKILLTWATNKQIQTNAPGKKGTVCFVQKPWVKRKLTLQNRPFLFKWSKTLGPLSQRKRAASAPIWSSLEDLELRKEITGGVDSLKRFPPIFRADEP